MPDWVHQAAQQTVGTLDPETKAVVLLDEFKYTIPGADDIIERYRRVVKIVRKEGREEGDFSVWVSHQGKVLSVHGWSIDKAGHEYEVKDKEFTERTPTPTLFMMMSTCARRTCLPPTPARSLRSNTKRVAKCGSGS